MRKSGFELADDGDTGGEETDTGVQKTDEEGTDDEADDEEAVRRRDCRP